MVREGTFFSRNLLQWTLCGGVYALLWLVGLGGIFTFTILLMASFGNEIHRWNHMSKTSDFVTFMKDTGLIQIQKQHSLHHKQPHNQYYCVMTSLLNAVLERVNFWRKLEWVVQATTGIAPKRENRRDSKPLKKKKTAKPQVAKTPSTKTAAPEAKPKETENDNQLASTPPTQTRNTNEPARKFPSLPVLESLKPASGNGATACRTADKSGCRNCSMCKLATASA